MDNYGLLIAKLDAFIRKYYKNQLIKGSLLTTAALLAAFLCITVPEYYLYFPKVVRGIMFFGFIALAVWMLVQYIIIPLLKYNKLGTIITHEQAAAIVGDHFADVKDRLLNVLQLKSQAVGAHDTDLIEASINQKANQLTPVPFTNAINIAVNRKYIKYLALPLGLVVFILLASPDVFRKSAARLVSYNKTFEREAPFQFIVTSPNMQVLQYQDYPLHVKINGQALPDEVYVTVDGYDYKLTKKSATEFEYVFNKVDKDTKFVLAAGGFNSHEYKLHVILKPSLAHFETALHYPAYIGRKDETQHDIGDMVVPEGTTIDWTFVTQNTDRISIKTNDVLADAQRHDGTTYTYTLHAKKDQPYTLYMSNQQVAHADSMNYTVTVIPDQYPTIQVSEAPDSVHHKIIYFGGEAADDYGLQKVNLHYILTHSDNPDSKPDEVNVPVEANVNARHSTFTYTWDISPLNIQPGDKITYYFEAWDNDGVNGSKSARSQAMTYEMPTVKQFEQEQKQTYSDIKSDLSSTIKQLKDLQNQMQKEYEKVLQKKDLNWEDKKQLAALLQKQEDLQKKLADVQKKFDNVKDQQDDFKKSDDDVKDKKDKLNDMMTDMNSDKMKDVMQKLKDMMDKMNKQNTLDQLKDNKYNNEQMQMDADRMLNLFKAMEFEEKMKDVKNKLDEMQQKQDSLSKESDKKGADKEAIEKKQDQLNKDFDALKQESKDLKDLNKGLEDPMPMPDWQDDEQKAKDAMQQSSDQLQQKKMSKASQSQKQAADKMKNISEQMQRFMDAMQMNQDEEDMHALRQILSNLLKLSFDQEDLARQTKEVVVTNPQYVDLMKSQHALIDNARMVEDSITQLGKRVFQIKTYVTEKITSLNKSLDASVENLEARNTGAAATQQQYSMTYFNDLALIFSELTDQQQKKMKKDQESQKEKKKGSGKGSCNSPGGSGQGNPTLKALQKMQGQLKDKITQMSGQMPGGSKPGSQQGNEPGGTKPGQQPGDKAGGNQPGGKQPGGKQGQNGSGGGGSGSGQEGENSPESQQLAQLAQQQAKIREMLKEMSDKLTGNGTNGDAKKMLDDMQKDMDRTETDLLNRRITQQTLQRQQDILNRMLDYDKAQRTQDQDNKRESHTAADIPHSVPPAIEEYLRKKQAENEMYHTVPPALQPFYKNLDEDYYKKIAQ